MKESDMSNDRCRWESALHQYRCSEPAIVADSYCILHSRKDDKEPDTFIRKVEERMRMPEKIDLIDCYFPKDFDGDYFKVRVFDKPVDFSGAVLSSCDFRDTRFMESAYFIGATFAQANFRGAVFSQEAYFIGAKFWQEADFGRAKFDSEADFIGAKFAQRVDFSGAIFSGETGFQNAVFSVGGRFFKTSFRDVRFTSAKFEGAANFDQTNFSAGTDFTRTEFHGGACFLKNTNKMPWRGCFRYALFGGSVTMQEADLSECSFLHSDVDKVDFRYCSFGKDKEYFLGFLPISRENVLCDEKEAKTNVEFDVVGRVYRDLVKNFDGRGDRHMATDFFYGEMECRRKQMGWLGRSFSLYALSRQITGYGVRFARSGFFIVLLTCVSCLFYRYCEGLHWGEAFNQSIFGINVLLAHIYHYSEELSSLGIAFFCFEIIVGTFLTTSFVLVIQRVFTPFK